MHKQELTNPEGSFNASRKDIRDAWKVYAYRSSGMTALTSGSGPWSDPRQAAEPLSFFSVRQVGGQVPFEPGEKTSLDCRPVGGDHREHG